jgi:hypothetical protein
VELPDPSPMTVQRPQAIFVIALLLAGLAIACAVVGWLDRL